MGFAAFFGEEKHFPVDRTDLKIVTRWRGCYCLLVPECPIKFSKFEKMGAKFVITTTAI